MRSRARIGRLCHYRLMSVGPRGECVERVVLSLGAEGLLALEELIGRGADADGAETIAAATGNDAHATSGGSDARRR